MLNGAQRRLVISAQTHIYTKKLIQFLKKLRETRNVAKAKIAKIVMEMIIIKFFLRQAG